MLEKSISPYTYSTINNGIDSQLLLAIVFYDFRIFNYITIRKNCQ